MSTQIKITITADGEDIHAEVENVESLSRVIGILEMVKQRLAHNKLPVVHARNNQPDTSNHTMD